MVDKSTPDPWVTAWAGIFRHINGQLDLLRAEQEKIKSKASTNPSKFFVAWQEDAFTSSWAHYYEKDFFRFLATTAVVSSPWLAVEILFENFDSLSRVTRILKNRHIESMLFNVQMKFFVPRTVAIDRSIQALLSSRRTINQLLLAAKSGDDSSLLKAIGFDPSVLTTITAKNRITAAAITHEKDFFEKLASVLKDPPVSEQLRDNARLNGAILLLMFAGQLNNLTQRRAAALFIDETKLYPRTHADPERSLWKLIQRRKKELATIFPEKMSSSNR